MATTKKKTEDITPLSKEVVEIMARTAGLVHDEQLGEVLVLTPPVESTPVYTSTKTGFLMESWSPGEKHKFCFMLDKSRARDLTAGMVLQPFSGKREFYFYKDRDTGFCIKLTKMPICG